jgi:hypothetical protein
MTTSSDGIGLKEALRIKSAEFWLMLGQPTMALNEIANVPRSTRQHPWVREVLLDAVRSVQEQNEA